MGAPGCRLERKNEATRQRNGGDLDWLRSLRPQGGPEPKLWIAMDGRFCETPRVARVVGVMQLWRPAKERAETTGTARRTPISEVACPKKQ